jgi:hypothetical protein
MQWRILIFNDLSEMASFGSNGFLVSNHSYGYGINDSFPTARFGYYDQTSADFDKVAEVFLLSNCCSCRKFCNSTNRRWQPKVDLICLRKFCV